VDDPAAMRVAQSLQHLPRVAQRLFERQSGRKPPPQVFALHAFHHHHQLLLMAERGVQRGNVRMMQRGQQTDLTHEPVHHLLRLQP
jgi:hypothetical protein